jgi:hypothetical protein
VSVVELLVGTTAVAPPAAATVVDSVSLRLDSGEDFLRNGSLQRILEDLLEAVSLEGSVTEAVLSLV